MCTYLFIECIRIHTHIYIAICNCIVPPCFVTACSPLVTRWRWRERERYIYKYIILFVYIYTYICNHMRILRYLRYCYRYEIGLQSLAIILDRLSNCAIPRGLKWDNLHRRGHQTGHLFNWVTDQLGHLGWSSMFLGHDPWSMIAHQIFRTYPLVN